MKLVLVGFMGSGKTTVSQLIGQKLRIPVLDLDQVIVKQAKRTIPQIFTESGEEGFRMIEHDALENISDLNGVLATGGGTVLRADNREIIHNMGALVVRLEASSEVIFKRLKNQTGRPLGDGLNVQSIEQMQNLRNGAYEDCSDLVINTDKLTAPEIADKITGMLV